MTVRVGDRVAYYRRRFGKVGIEEKTGVVLQTDGMFATIRIETPQGAENVRVDVRQLRPEETEPHE